MNRVIVWFSCGAASAVTAKLASEKYANRLEVVYCDTSLDEHPDNQRFLFDVEKWIGLSIKRIRSSKYQNVDEVIEKTRYMSGVAGARCTTELKKIPRFQYQQPDDFQLFGLCADEQKRIERFEKNNPDLNLEWILRDRDIKKEDCFKILKQSGIERPIIYDVGFDNANCIGCLKAQGAKYWNLVRIHRPDIFEKRCEQSRELGVRLVKIQGKRIFLDELDPNAGKRSKVEIIDCGPQCISST